MALGSTSSIRSCHTEKAFPHLPTPLAPGGCRAPQNLQRATPVGKALLQEHTNTHGSMSTNLPKVSKIQCLQIIKTHEAQDA